jgi:hypothetical protein
LANRVPGPGATVSLPAQVSPLGVRSHEPEASHGSSVVRVNLGDRASCGRFRTATGAPAHLRAAPRAPPRAGSTGGDSLLFALTSLLHTLTTLADSLTAVAGTVAEIHGGLRGRLALDATQAETAALTHQSPQDGTQGSNGTPTADGPAKRARRGRKATAAA